MAVLCRDLGSVKPWCSGCTDGGFSAGLHDDDDENESTSAVNSDSIDIREWIVRILSISCCCVGIWCEVVWFVMFFAVLLVDDVGLWFFYARRNLMAGASEAVPMPLELFDIDHEEWFVTKESIYNLHEDCLNVLRKSLSWCLFFVSNEAGARRRICLFFIFEGQTLR